MSDPMKGSQQPTHEEIRACAQRIYETEGRPEGKATEHWLKAEAQLRAERKVQASSSPKKAAKAAPPANAAERAPKTRATTPWPGQNAPRQAAHHN